MSELSELKWQCRRGVKELDLVLLNYLEQYYLTADKKEQALFKQLLKLEDSVLFDFILGNSSADNHEQQNLIIKLRHSF